MVLNKWVAAAICLTMGALQAWDSGVLAAEPMVQVLVALAIALPLAGLLATESYGVRAGAVATAFVLVTVARLSSSAPLPTLGMVVFIPAIVIFYSHLVGSRAEARAGSVKS